MKKTTLQSFLLFIVGVVSGFIIVILFTTIIFFKFISGLQTPITYKSHSWLILNYSGSITEKPNSNFLSLFDRTGSKIQLIQLMNAIESAGFDEKIDGILINADTINYSSAHIEEIKKALILFKKWKKPVYAYFSTGNNLNYDMCLAADKIFMPNTQSADLSLTGYARTIPYFKSLADKIGLDFTVIHIGSYKGTGENYNHDNMTDEFRYSYTSLLDSMQEENLKQISQSRNINTEKLRTLFQSGNTILMTPERAKELGFIDEIKNTSDMMHELSKNDEDPSTISIDDYISLHEHNKFDQNKIAVIYAEGTIDEGNSGSSRFSGDIVGADSLIQDIRHVQKDKSIKAVILRVNSPGGSALASELILQSLLELKKTKPLYVSFGPVAASGGYYISCAGDRIFTSSSTITGSIGVVSISFNHSLLDQKLGINFETIKKYKYDDFFFSNRQPTAEEIAILRRSMTHVYTEFTNHVSTERKIDPRALVAIAEGRVWTGSQAIENRLADEIGGLKDAIKYAAEKNQLNTYSLESYPKPASFLDKILDTGQIKINFNTFNDLSNINQLMNLYQFSSHHQRKPLVLLPFIP